MAARQVVGLFDTMEHARDAVQALRDAGFESNDISLVARNQAATTAADDGTSEAAEGAGAGAVAGSVLGGLTGLLIGLGALVLPGIGPAITAGTLATALGTAAAGAGIGAASGGLLGALVGAGIPEEDANIYAEGVRRGGALITVQAVSETEAERAAELMDRYGVVDIDERAANYRAGGWSRFDQDADTVGDTGSGVGAGVGTLSGAATGAALGSAGGPLGTVIGGVAGALTGGALGAAGDRLGVEATDDDQMTGTDFSRSSATLRANTNDTARSLPDVNLVGSNDDLELDRPRGTMVDTGMTANTMASSISTASTTGGTLPSGTSTSTTGDFATRQLDTTTMSALTTRPTLTNQTTPTSQTTTPPAASGTGLGLPAPKQEQTRVHEVPASTTVPADVDLAALDQLQEGVFEVRGRAEVVTITKEARVIEEVVINKTVEERTEVVMDTVRQVDVNVEELPAQATAATPDTTLAQGVAAPLPTTAREGEVVLPVIEENITVSKREVEGSGVRVEVRTNELPVREEVTLRRERVTVERRPADRVIALADVNQFDNILFQAREHDEQVIVEKTARVVEEIVLNKQAQQVMQTVQDTVRRTEVDVRQVEAAPRPSPATTTNASTSQALPAAQATTSNDQAVIPVIEENLVVSKQQVDAGGVQVETRVTETPFNQQVQLRDEEIHVERRPVDRVAGAGEFARVQQGVFTLREHNEAVVVNKTAQIVEEIAISKQTTERTETVQDTVRRTAIDVENVAAPARTLDASNTTTTTRVTDTTSGTTGNEGLIERGLSKAENAVERATGLDLDHDRHVGQRDPGNNVGGI